MIDSRGKGPLGYSIDGERSGMMGGVFLPLGNAGFGTISDRLARRAGGEPVGIRNMPSREKRPVFMRADDPEELRWEFAAVVIPDQDEKGPGSWMLVGE